ncbi:DNA processing protein DprA [Photobacterium jeanii]|uniref:DNA processing protein DprA n=1 Tax=Photobacterium jeanii TaxID=858640 RepID=A0A178K7I0_9GAMM|nr:DNA-processing protein DprA [Photobacterium jeanii]OAN12623.1 DNA processing protein DprA [Photobacterium jeanii]PST86596.1 DNA-protecting protein DprA [Photobacterium jeanii]
MNEVSDWLALCAVPQLGAVRIGRLLQHGPPAYLRQLSVEQLQALGLRPNQITTLHQPNWARIEHCLQWASHPDHHILTLDSPFYPPLLKEIPAAPPVLFVAGELGYLSAPQLAIVGSRSASIDGRELAYEFAAAMVAADFVVTSGLALGIDGQAHLGALKHGGATVAVLGAGLAQLYPARHRDLAAKIKEQGALVSEFWPDEKPRPQNFPRRNRVISGLSVGVLVVEAAQKSGSLITARYALEQGRDVFALPGSVRNPESRGCHALIKSGAKLVETPVDIFEEVGALTECAINNQLSRALPQGDDQQLPFQALLANVGGEATPVDVVAERSGQPVHEVMMQLLELELLGVVTSVPGGYIKTRRGKS